MGTTSTKQVLNALDNIQLSKENYQKLLDIKHKAEDLRSAQRAYMNDRGNETLGKAVGVAAVELDVALEAIK